MRKVGRVKLGRRKLKVLGYADDLVILIEEEEGMRWLMKRLETYLDRKGLVLNVEKTKVIRFGREEKRKKKEAKVEEKGDRRRR